MTQTNPETIATGAARLRAEISGHLACVTISYPERHNIIDLEGWLAFPGLMARLGDIERVASRAATRPTTTSTTGYKAHSNGLAFC